MTVSLPPFLPLPPPSPLPPSRPEVPGEGADSAVIVSRVRGKEGSVREEDRRSHWRPQRCSLSGGCGQGWVGGAEWAGLLMEVLPANAGRPPQGKVVGGGGVSGEAERSGAETQGGPNTLPESGRQEPVSLHSSVISQSGRSLVPRLPATPSGFEWIFVIGAP